MPRHAMPEQTIEMWLLLKPGIQNKNNINGMNSSSLNEIGSKSILFSCLPNEFEFNAIHWLVGNVKYEFDYGYG